VRECRSSLKEDRCVSAEPRVRSRPQSTEQDGHRVRVPGWLGYSGWPEARVARVQREGRERGRQGSGWNTARGWSA
jgi:hypothetical protein